MTLKNKIYCNPGSNFKYRAYNGKCVEIVGCQPFENGSFQLIGTVRYCSRMVGRYTEHGQIIVMHGAASPHDGEWNLVDKWFEIERDEEAPNLKYSVKGVITELGTFYHHSFLNLQGLTKSELHIFVQEIENVSNRLVLDEDSFSLHHTDSAFPGIKSGQLLPYVGKMCKITITKIGKLQ